MILSDLIDIMNSIAPPILSESWDNCGLQIGDENKDIKKILLALNAVDNVVDEAIKNNVDLIITHHPFIFKGIKSISSNTYKGNIIYKLIKNNVALFAAHTNLDIANEGVNDVLAKLLDLENTQVLKVTRREKSYKIVVFVPESHGEMVRDAISNKGAGWIGNYSHCTYNTNGFGTFMPRENTNPYIGKEGVVEKVNEVRIETIVPHNRLNNVLNAMIKSHPYEEVAYDIYPLENKGQEWGLGRIGEMKTKVSLWDFANNIKSILGSKGLKFYGNISKDIKRVAVCGGSGAEFISDAHNKGADVYITSDIKYHDAQNAMERNLALIDAGHYYTEKIVLPELKSRLEKIIDEDINIIISDKDDCSPYNIL